MKKHNGMRPQDIVILFAIIAKGTNDWMMKDLANELHISASEISDSLNRSTIAGLINSDKKKVKKQALLEFLFYGINYVFPQKPGPIVRGIPTAHSAPVLSNIVKSSDKYVWPYYKGLEKGQAIEPLYSPSIEATLNNEVLYKLLSLTDAIRVGRAREKSLAQHELKLLIQNEP